MELQGRILAIPARSDPERDALAAAWIARGGEVVRLDRFWEPPALDPARVRLYGPETFCWVVAEKLQLELLSPPDDFLLALDSRWLGREMVGSDLAGALAGDFPVFVKSVVPKLFRSRVYDRASELADETRGLEPGTRVLVAERVEFASEFRVFVRGSEVCAVGLYEGTGDLAGAREFADRFLAENPQRVPAALDIGEIAGRGFAVVEANAAWGAGLNGCEASAVIPCIAVACRRRAIS